MSADHHDQPLHSVSVAGVIIDDAQQNVLLIQRRDNGHWEPPGGVLELNETIDDGLRREIREETGVNVNIDRLTGVYKNLSRGIVALVYRCHAHGEPALATPEAAVVSWQPLVDIDQIMAPVYAIRVHDALTHGVQTRAHDGKRLVQDNVVPWSSLGDSGVVTVGSEHGQSDYSGARA